MAPTGGDCVVDRQPMQGFVMVEVVQRRGLARFISSSSVVTAIFSSFFIAGITKGAY